MSQNCQPCSPAEAGMAFTGTPEALSAMQAFAEATGAVMLWRENGCLPSPFLLLQVKSGAEVKPAERLYNAFIEGKFPGVEAAVLEPADEHLSREMRGE